MNVAGKDRIRGWLELMRLPNLFTVPGDVLAGYVAAGAGLTAGLPAAIVTALFLYAAGLVLNDLVDVDIDRLERPRRPLPSGRVGVRAARMLAGVLLGGALVVAGAHQLSLFMTAIMLGSLVFIYNVWAKRTRFAGAVVLGLCRAGSVALGVAAGGGFDFVQELPWVLMVWWMCYIAAVSWLAAREMKEGAYGWERWSPLVIIMAGAGWLLFRVDAADSAMVSRAGFAFIFAALIAWQCGSRLILKAARHHPPTIGWLISAIIPMQAGVVVLLVREPWMLLAALLILFCWPLNRWLAKSWAAS